MSNKKTRYDEIREALNQGWTYKQVIEKFKVSPKTIRRLRDDDYPPRQRGRPTVVTPEIRSFIETNSLADARTTDGCMCGMIENHFGVKISRATVASTRSSLGFKFRPPMTRQILTPEQVDARQEFCCAIAGGDEVVPNLVFSDESRFEKAPDNSWRRIKRGAWNDSCFVQKSKFTPGVMVWAAIAVGYKSPLVICRGTVNSVEYCRVLEDSRVVTEMNARHGVGHWTFMQDGAPSHLSEKTMAWLRERKVAVLP